MNTRPSTLLTTSLIVLTATISQISNTNPIERSADLWLEDMIVALREVNYEGTIGHFDGSDLTSLHFSQVIVDGVEYERMCHLNGARRELMRSGSRVLLYVDEDETRDLAQLMEEWPKLAVSLLFSKKFNSLKDIYFTSLMGEDRIAQRDAIIIDVIPKRADRYGFRLWIDKETALLLRAEMRDETDELLEAVMFTSIEIDSLSPYEFMAQVDVTSGNIFELPFDEDSRDTIADSQWAREWVPQGFAVYKEGGLSAADGRSHQNQSGSKIHYSDGMVTFSLFIEKTDETGMGDIETSDGPTTVVSRRTLDHTGNPYRVTVVGELPKQTAWRIARGVKPVR